MKKEKSKTPGSSGNGRTRAARVPKRRTHFVPKVVFRTAFAGVIPVCVAASSSECGGLVGASVAYVGFSQPDANSDGALVGQPVNCDPAVTACCNGYPCGTVASTAFSGDVAAVAFGVANAAFDGGGATDGGDAGTDASDAGFDAGEASDGSSDASAEEEGSFCCYVAALAFGDSVSSSFGDAGLDANTPDGTDE